MQVEKICLGAIVGVHGIKGEVKVKSFTSVAEDIDAYGELSNEAGDKKFSIKVVGQSKELLRVKVKGVSDRNQAEALVGTGLYANKDVLPELDEEEFYHADLIGLKVKNPQGQEIGQVAGLYNFGAGDLIEIKLSATNKTELLPFTETYVPEISLKDGYIIVEEMTFSASEENEENEG